MTNLDTKALEAAREAYDAPLLPHMTLRERMLNKVSDEREISIRIRLAIEAYLSAASPRPSGEAGEVQCCMCGKTGLSIIEGDGGSECQLSDGRWTCSADCYDRALPTIKEPTDGK